jgi:flagellar biosynthetic protein FliQ
MHSAEIIHLMRDFLWTGLLMVAPAVLTSLLVGLAISIFQTVTSIQEQTLTFAPRIVAVSIVVGVSLAWTLNLIVSFTQRVMAQMIEYGVHG